MKGLLCFHWLMSTIPLSKNKYTVFSMTFLLKWNFLLTNQACVLKSNIPSSVLSSVEYGILLFSMEKYCKNSHNKI